MARDLATLGGLALDTSAAARESCSIDRWPRLVKLAQAGRRPALVDGVVRPRTAAEVAAALADASAAGIAVMPVGLRSGVVGGLQPGAGTVAIDLSALDRIEEIDAVSLTVRAGAGTRGSTLEAHLAEHRLTLGHYPQSLPISSLGGWVACRASGISSSLHGSIERRLVAVEVALADGSLIETPAWPRGSVGPDLSQLFIGSEGTLGVVCAATLRVRRAPARRRFAAFALPGFEAGLALVRDSVQAGVVPAIIRLYNETEAARFLDDPPAALLLLVHEGLPELLAAEASVLAGAVADAGGAPLSRDVADRWWEGRFDAGHLFDYAKRPGGVADAIEVAADWATVPRLARRIETELDGLAARVELHASHFYEDGASLYAIVFMDAAGPLEALDLYDRVWGRVMGICLEEGAAISHHHGIGAVRVPMLEDALGTSAEVLRRVKAGLDPAGILSPGRLGLGGPVTTS